jgi:shikimate dehydrogenase
VTIPHKVEAMQNVDQVDPTAEGIGCINTVVNQDGRLLGYNSDGLGALGALRDAGADPRGRRALVLGSGGAARAIAMTLALEAPPERLAIMGIEVPQLEQLAEDVRQRGVSSEVVAIESTPGTMQAEMKSAEIVLHCSPIGMHPHEDASLVPAALFRSEQVVFDAVYNPRQTRLLREAAQAGCRTIQGLEMFLGQAYVQFRLWTGQEPPRDVMRAIVEARL